MMMDDEFFPFEIDDRKTRHKGKSSYGWHPRQTEEDGFKCVHCSTFVSAATFLSGVQNRNHCPYCLWSRHLDLRKAGDRLSACKAGMSPVGLSLKTTQKKYGSRYSELMIIHACEGCEKIDINRIASDDVAEHLLEVFEESLHLDEAMQARLAGSGVLVLGADDADLVRSRLFGHTDDEEESDANREE